VGAALVRAERREVVPAGQAVELVRAFSTVPVERHWHPSDPVEALALVNTTTYADAWYLAMAARLGCAVMTLGASMAAAAAMHGIPIADRTGLPS
jgi:predicted nucleic acid-binding protein